MDMATKTNHLVVNEEFKDKENDNQPNLHRVKKNYERTYTCSTTLSEQEIGWNKNQSTQGSQEKK